LPDSEIPERVSDEEQGSSATETLTPTEDQAQNNTEDDSEAAPEVHDAESEVEAFGNEDIVTEQNITEIESPEQLKDDAEQTGNVSTTTEKEVEETPVSDNSMSSSEKLKGDSQQQEDEAALKSEWGEAFGEAGLDIDEAADKSQ
jgi:hypothetical protein